MSGLGGVGWGTWQSGCLEFGGATRSFCELVIQTSLGPLALRTRLTPPAAVTDALSALGGMGLLLLLTFRPAWEPEIPSTPRSQSPD